MNTPKFKEGDWIKRKKDGRIAQVVMLLKTCYSLRLADGDCWWLDYDSQDNWELTAAPPKNKLEEAADEYEKGYYDDCSAAKRAAYHGFIAGAKWQEKKDQETIKLAEDHAFLAGADWQKEQMMKEAVKWLVDDDYDTKTDEGGFILGSMGIGYNGYYIPYSGLLKLPKEDDQ